jgi:hypothetical protein
MSSSSPSHACYNKHWQSSERLDHFSFLSLRFLSSNSNRRRSPVTQRGKSTAACDLQEYKFVKWIRVFGQKAKSKLLRNVVHYLRPEAKTSQDHVLQSTEMYINVTLSLLCTKKFYCSVFYRRSSPYNETAKSLVLISKTFTVWS